MKKLLPVWVLLLIVTATSCGFGGQRVSGNGNVVTQTRSIDGASSVSVVGGINVEIKKGPTSAIVIADENLQNYIILEKRQDGISIRTKEGYNINSDNDIKVVITTPVLEEIKTVGSGDVTCIDKFDTNGKIKLVSSGSGDINADFKAPEVLATIAGSGTIVVKGEAREVKISIAGSGDFKGEALKSETADLSVSGSGDASIYASVSLKASINGSGSIKYGGSPNVSTKVRGSGSVERL